MTVLIGPNGIQEKRVIHVKRQPFTNDDHETIERKGIGHPDTLADTLASLISQAYSKYTWKHCDGQVLHHQIDKLMVIGGKTSVTWGEGKFVNPIKIIVAGRASATYMGRDIPVMHIITETIRNYFSVLFPIVNFDTDVVVINELTTFAGPGTIKESTGSISQMFNPKIKGEVRGYEKLVANDTSFCVYYSGFTKLEEAVLYVEGYLNSPTTKKIYSWLGTDIKIMATRNFAEYRITLCIPQIAAYVHSMEEYLHNLEVIGKIVEKKFADKGITNATISINTKDDYEKKNFYLTVSGSSLSGDIGVVGRGNRVNGLITSSRPMSMEGTNGKNPRYYSGFIYAVLSKKISQRIFALGNPNIVEIISQNGGPLLKPWQVTITADVDEKHLRKIVDEECAAIPQITLEFMDGLHTKLC